MPITITITITGTITSTVKHILPNHHSIIGRTLSIWVPSPSRPPGADCDIKQRSSYNK